MTEFKERFRKLIAVVLSAGLIVPPGGAPWLWAAEVITVDGIMVGDDEVTVKLSADAQHQSFTTANPPRIILQLSDAEYQAGSKILEGQGRFLKRVRSGQFQRTPKMVSRVVLDLKEMVAFEVIKGDGELKIRLAGGGADRAQQDETPLPGMTQVSAEAPASEPAVAPKPEPIKEDSELHRIAQTGQVIPTPTPPGSPAPTPAPAPALRPVRASRP
ncbi:MAG: AMIN domain-containing protein, partial [Elusimicrobia bacterium]|nr:AMIN domain-containing protein [Elusimicrobiota bacterium]